MSVNGQLSNGNGNGKSPVDQPEASLPVEAVSLSTLASLAEYDSTKEDADLSAPELPLPLTVSECPDSAGNTTTDPVESPTSDLEAGLVELLETLKPWAPYLKQLTERQNEILQLLQQPLPTLPVAPLPSLSSDMFAEHRTLHGRAYHKACMLLSDRLQRLTPGSSGPDWYRWAMVEAFKLVLKVEGTASKTSEVPIEP